MKSSTSWSSVSFLKLGYFEGSPTFKYISLWLWKVTKCPMLLSVFIWGKTLEIVVSRADSVWSPFSISSHPKSSSKSSSFRQNSTHKMSETTSVLNHPLHILAILSPLSTSPCLHHVVWPAASSPGPEDRDGPLSRCAAARAWSRSRSGRSCEAGGPAPARLSRGDLFKRWDVINGDVTSEEWIWYDWIWIWVDPNMAK